MNNLILIELLRSDNLNNSVKLILPYHKEPKNKNVGSMMISCIDNYGNGQKFKSLTTFESIKPELSLNYLFEVAKEEHFKINHK